MSFRFLCRIPATGKLSPVTPSLLTTHVKRHESRQASTSVSMNETSLTVHSLGTAFPYVWLRDSCQSPLSVHPATSQKLHRTSDIPLDIKPIPDGVRSTDDGIHIEWTTGHKSFYSFAFLERHSSPGSLTKFHKDLLYEPWDAESISKVPDLFLPYASFQQPAGILAAITQLSRYGILFITGVPNKETSNDTCELRRLAEHFGEIRHTFYGQVWDVKNVRNSRNIAYTNLDLGLHMDLLYVPFSQIHID
jgi:gamma-butyrobetaine dioxygenase